MSGRFPEGVRIKPYGNGVAWCVERRRNPKEEDKNQRVNWIISAYPGTLPQTVKHIVNSYIKTKNEENPIDNAEDLLHMLNQVDELFKTMEKRIANIVNEANKQSNKELVLLFEWNIV